MQTRLIQLMWSWFPNTLCSSDPPTHNTVVTQGPMVCHHPQVTNTWSPKAQCCCAPTTSSELPACSPPCFHSFYSPGSSHLPDSDPSVFAISTVLTDLSSPHSPLHEPHSGQHLTVFHLSFPHMSSHSSFNHLLFAPWLRCLTWQRQTQMLPQETLFFQTQE